MRPHIIQRPFVIYQGPILRLHVRLDEGGLRAKIQAAMSNISYALLRSASISLSSGQPIVRYALTRCFGCGEAGLSLEVSPRWSKMGPKLLLPRIDIWVVWTSNDFRNGAVFRDHECVKFSCSSCNALRRTQISKSVGSPCMQ